jgi:hypothetical protein
MLTAIIPHPHGLAFRKEIYGSDVEDLARNVREFISEMCYGASDIGSQFNVYVDGKQTGLLAYNGKFTTEF